MMMLPGILLVQFSMSFLLLPRVPITTGTVVVLSPRIRSTAICKSLYLFFNLFRGLTEVLVSRGIVMSMRSQVLSFLLFSTMSGLLAATVPSVWMGMSTQNGDSLGFMLIPSFLHLNAKLFAELLVHVCNCLAVTVDVQPETRLSMVSSKRPHSLHFGSMSGFLRLLNCVSTSVLGGFNVGMR